MFIQQGLLASTLQSQENLLAGERNIKKAQEDIQYWILQQTKLESKRTALLEERNFHEMKLREINEKLEDTQYHLAQIDSKIKEYSPMLQEATILSITVARNKRAFSKIVIDSNTILTKFRNAIVNNF